MPTIRGTYDVREDYKMLDIVAMDGGAFIAKHHNPSICPGDGWQLLSPQGNQVTKARPANAACAENVARRASPAYQLCRGRSIASDIARAASAPFCDVPDKGMFRAARWKSEEPITVLNTCASKLHCLPDRLPINSRAGRQ
jgi:hypothetical protein